jgi:hypothetical protein
MASVFSTNEGPCSIFAPTGPCGGGAQETLSFARAAHLLYGTAPTQDARGEVALSFVGIGQYAGEMQPLDIAVLRHLGGIVIEQAWLFLVVGSTNVCELDRVYVDGYQLEVTQVGKYAGSHEEISLKHIGR